MFPVDAPAIRLTDKRQDNDVVLNLLLLLGYACFTGFVLYRHEPYFDELHAWVIVLQSHSLAELHANKVYEGHPDGWYVLLYAISQFTTNIFWMKVAHWLLIVAAMALLVRHAPFPFSVKTLLLFGYLFSYEYAAISRNYALGILSLFGVCALFPYRHRPRGYLAICGLLALLFQASAMTALVGCALFAMLGLEILLYQKERVINQWPIYLLGVALLTGGMLFFLWTVSPPPDLSLYWIDRQLTPERFLWSVTYFANAFVQIPADPWYFWNTALLEVISHKPTQLLAKCLLVAVLFFFVTIPLLRSQLALLGWLVACGLIFTMLYTQYPGIFRHHGHFFIAFVCLLWVQPLLPDYTPTPNVPGQPQIIVRIASSAWISLLLIQVGMAIFAGYQDIKRPFSLNKQAAELIVNGPYKDHLLVGYLDHIGESVAAYLPNRAVYYPSSGRWNGYLKNTKNVRFLSPEQLADSIQCHRKGPALLLLNGPIPDPKADSLGFKPVRFLVGSILPDEQMMLYEIK